MTNPRVLPSAPQAKRWEAIDTRYALHLADCLVWMDAQPERSVHAIVTDPPYGILPRHDGGEAEAAKPAGRYLADTSVS